MNYRSVTLFCFCFSLFYTSCKKEKSEVVLFPASTNGTQVIFTNTTFDTAFLDFALVRIVEAHLYNGRPNDGFALDTGTLPVTLLPNSDMALEKQRFVFKIDTLRNEDVLKTMSYNIRYVAAGDSVRRVKIFSKTF